MYLASETPPGRGSVASELGECQYNKSGRSGGGGKLRSASGFNSGKRGRSEPVSDRFFNATFGCVSC
jgi:hypothetical protein